MDGAKAGMIQGTIESAPILPAGHDPNLWRVLVFGPRPNRTLARVVVWGVLTIGFFHHLMVPIQIVGSSMWPTYQSGSLNFVNKRSYTKATPIRGDVIALQSDGELLLKRIVGLPGEMVCIWQGQILINEQPLADSFSRHKIPWEMDPVALGPSEYFVIGDNRAASIFCRVDRTHILGKIVF